MFVLKREIALWIALLSGACAAQPGSEGRQKAPAAVQPRPLEAPFLVDCQERCERGRAMQAVAIEMIRAGCAEECRAAWALPLFTEGAQIDAAQSSGGEGAQRPAMDGRARLWGRVEARGEGWALVLEDGRRLALVSADAGPPPLGAAVVVGTLEGGGVVGAWVLPQKAEEKGGM